MNVFRNAKLARFSPVQTAIALGNFDGLHLGHQALFQRVLDLSRSESLSPVAFTFDPHPVQVLDPEKNHQNLFTRLDLEEHLQELGLGNLVLEPFTRQFSRLTGEEFLRGWVAPLNPRHVVVGPDFSFGRDRVGTQQDLARVGDELGFQTHVVSAVEVDGRPVSSTWIRQVVLTGDLNLATRLLGRPFSVSGTVVSGAGRGRTLQIPTANVHPQGTLLPPRGVYATCAWWKGVGYTAVTNVGVAPTFNVDGQVKLETHILDQNLNMGGSRLQVEFISYLRGEKKFTGPEELVRQIRLDIEAARQVGNSINEVGRNRS